MAAATLTIGGRTFTVAPPTLGLLKRCLSLEASLATLPPLAQVDALAVVALDAVKRSHPEVTKAEIEELVDTENIAAVIESLMVAAGLKRAAPGEA